MDSCSIASGQSNYALENLIPAKYFPQSNLFSRIARSNQLLWYVWSNGQMGIVNFYNSTLTQQLGDAQITYSYQYSANNSNIQIKVIGWKSIKITDKIHLFVNGDTRTCILTGSQVTVSASSSEISIGTIPQQYWPAEVFAGSTFCSGNAKIRIENGSINIYNGNTNPGVMSITVTYPY